MLVIKNVYYCRCHELAEAPNKMSTNVDKKKYGSSQFALVLMPTIVGSISRTRAGGFIPPFRSFNKMPTNVGLR